MDLEIFPNKNDSMKKKFTEHFALHSNITNCKLCHPPGAAKWRNSSICKIGHKHRESQSDEIQAL